MDCPACGFANPPAFKFCGSGAASLRPIGACPHCTTVNPPGFKFCGECAGPLEISPARPSAVEQRERWNTAVETWSYPRSSVHR